MPATNLVVAHPTLSIMMQILHEEHKSVVSIHPVLRTIVEGFLIDKAGKLCLLSEGLETSAAVEEMKALFLHCNRQPPIKRTITVF